jgi:NAD(P)-dependent dehydrogenase (short-subunit alcohol dehydrogenase family)
LSTDASEAQVDLTGQVALVTGGGDGLGRAFALALARAGVQVALTARRPEPLTETTELIERLGGRGLAIPGDVTVPDAVAGVMRTAESRLGPIDILVNNAGALGPLGYDWQVDPEDWVRTFEVNVLGAFRCAREVLVGMVKRKRGRIVNITSGAGFSRLPQMGAYCATKAALTQWTKTLAADTRAHGVSVFALHPGMVHTPMLAKLATSPDVPRQVGDTFRALLNQGRETPIERSAEMLLFLVSGRADALSGRFIRAKEDDEVVLVQRAEEIQQNDLHIVTLRT